MRKMMVVKSVVGLMLLGGAVPPALMAQDQQAVQYQPFSEQQMDDLTAPVALYPDALLSEILVASTYPLEVVEASQWVAAGNNPDNVDQQPWDQSVKGLTHFPAVLKQMASDAAWTNDLGAAFLNQQADVFASVQRLRAQAIANGTLYSTPQQQVVQDGGVIQIIPTDPNTIYVPSYSPEAVFEPQDVPVGTEIAPPITYVYSAPVGPWLAFDCDWDDHRIYTGDWGRERPWWHWHDRDWHYSNFRPGHFTAPAHENWKPREWSHDSKRETPRYQPLPSARPDRRVPLARPEGFPEINRGARAAQDAERGRIEREREQHATSDAERAHVEPQREQHPTPDAERGHNESQREQHATPPERVAPRPAPERQAPTAHEAPPDREAPIHRETSGVHEAPPAPRTPPARETPRLHEAPPAREAPQVHEAPPAREAPAFNSNERGEDAARASQRGSESRGGGGGPAPARSAPPAGGSPPAGGGGGGPRGHR